MCSSVCVAMRANEGEGEARVIDIGEEDCGEVRSMDGGAVCVQGEMSMLEKCGWINLHITVQTHHKGV